MLEDLCDAAVSIKFKSEDGQISDYLSSPQKQIDNIFKVKCYKCYGTNSFNCSQCKGMQRIYSNHPFAQLLGQILNRKLHIGRPIVCEEKQDHHQRVYPIKQEEEDNDEKKEEITLCQIKYKYSKIVEQINDTQGISIRQSYCFSQIDLLTSDIGKQQTSNSSKQNKLCSNCFHKIQNCYSLCKTCDAQNIKYWICDQCSDNSSYLHYPNHYFQAVIDYDSYKHDDLEGLTYDQFKEQTISQEFINHQDKMEFIQDTPYSTVIPNILTANTSIAKHLDDKAEIFQCNQQKIPAVSRVRFQLDNLFSSSGFSVNQQTHSKSFNESNHQQNINIVKLNDSRKRKLKRKSSNVPSKQNQENNIDFKIKRVSSIHCSYFNQAKHIDDYIFLDYVCDHCNISPIINIRHHCLECLDYDLCDTCFKVSNVHTQHQFNKIDGRQIRQKARVKIFQDKDINMVDRCGQNLKRTCLLSQKSNRNKQTKGFLLNITQKQRMSII